LVAGYIDCTFDGIGQIPTQDVPSCLSPTKLREMPKGLTRRTNCSTAVACIYWCDQTTPGLVLEQGQTRIEDTAANILADPRIAQLFLGGGLATPERIA
jgi:hypothetical protein